MNRKTVWLVAVVLLVLLLAVLVGWQAGQRRREASGEPDPLDVPESLSEEVAKAKVTLYFPGAGARLFAEAREVEAAEDLEIRLTRLVEALLAGPQSPDLFPSFPAEASLGWVYVDPTGIAWVDLELGDGDILPSWGSGHEMLAVYSLVDTILLNLEDVEAVAVLRNGQQETTFAGHLDTSRPLHLNRQLIASRG